MSTLTLASITEALSAFNNKHLDVFKRNLAYQEKQPQQYDD